MAAAHVTCTAGGVAAAYITYVAVCGGGAIKTFSSRLSDSNTDVFETDCVLSRRLSTRDHRRGLNPDNIRPISGF